jgi:O-antigen/teichoic acid export membrane protein
MAEKPQVISKSHKFTLDVIWVSLSQIFVSFVGIFTLAALTKSYTSEMFGIWAQVSVTVGLLSPIINLQFGPAIVRFIAGEDDRLARRRALGSMLCSILIFGFMVSILAFFSGAQLSSLFFDSPRYTTFVHLTFLWGFVDALYLLFISYLRARDRIKRLSLIQGLFAVSKMAVIVTLAVLNYNLEWIILGNILIEFTITIVMFYFIVRQESFPVLNFYKIREFLSFSLPQLPAGAMMWAIAASDRYFIAHYLNLSQTGIYSSSNSLASLMAFFYYPIGFVLLPAVSRAWEQNNKNEVKTYFTYSIKLFLTAAIPAAIGLALLSQQLLKVLTTSEYLAGMQIVLLVSIGQIFMGLYQINDYILYLLKQTKWEPLLIFVAAAVSVVINISLIPAIGITGAAISKIVSYFVLSIILIIWVRKVLKYSFDFIYLGKVILAALLMALGIYFIKIDGIPGIILSTLSGAGIYLILLFLLNAFSKQDKELIKENLRHFFPKTRK